MELLIKVSAVTVNDAQVAALRAFLELDADDTERLIKQLIETGPLDGYGELVSAAFATAVRRHFPSGWTIADVIGTVASARARLINEGVEIDPHAAEILTRRTLGDSIAVELDEEVSARAQIFLLSELIIADELDDTEIDDFLAAARELADQLLDRGRQA